MLYFEKGSPTYEFTPEAVKQAVAEAFGKIGGKRKVLAVVPDITRLYSRAGELTGYLRDHYGEKLTDILFALGTHKPMTAGEIEQMYPGLAMGLFRHHDWRSDTVTVGEVPGEFLAEVSGGKVCYPWPAQLNRLIWQGGHDLIVSIGQVVPHEVVGMANYNKNIFVGTGGPEGINKSHFLGAVYGMEKMMGRADTPVRKVLNYAQEHFASHLPFVTIRPGSM